ncbi:MAG: phosphotransferase, partial [Planctomycetes bacterium]|nr:phosphotransferase [Planctomycetota bacterium]
VQEILGQSGGRFSVRFHRETAGRTAELAGRWLAHFHCWPVEGPCEPYDIPVRAKWCETNLAYLESHGLPAAEADEVRRLLARVQGKSVRDIAVTIHGDFKPSNLMVSEGAVIGIDMEGYHRGHPLIDVGQFLVHASLTRSSSMWGMGPAAWWSHLARRFLVGYRAVADWDLGGVDFRLMDATLAVLANLASRNPGLLWRLRGRDIMVRMVRQALKAASKEVVGG